MNKKIFLFFVGFLFVFSISISAPENKRWIAFSSSIPKNPEMTASTQLESFKSELSTRSRGIINFSFSLPGYYEISSPSKEQVVILPPGGSLQGSSGTPVIPFYSVPLALPPNAEVNYVDIVSDEVQTITGIEPQTSTPYVVTPEGPKKMSEKKIDIFGLYPTDIYKLNIQERRDGCTQGILIIYPVQYDPLRKICVLHKNFHLSVHFYYRKYSQEEIKKRTVPQALEDGKIKYQNYGKFNKGQRKKNRGILLSNQSGIIFQNSFLVEENGANEFSMIASSHWFEEVEGRLRRNSFGILTYRNETLRVYSEDHPQLTKLKSYQILSENYKNVVEIHSFDNILSLIQNEWISSPGLIVFCKGEKDVPAALTPLASYLNWPLIGIVPENDTDHAQLQQLLSALGCKYMILGGSISLKLMRARLNPGIIPIPLREQDEINQFLLMQRSYEERFWEPSDHFVDKFYQEEVLNKDFLLCLGDFILPQYSPQSHLVLYSTADTNYSTAAALLAAYRGSNIENVSGYSANSVRNRIKYYNPYYVALMGDGDSGEVTCYYVNDPVDDGADDISEPGGSTGNGIIPTDFYYELYEDPEIGSIPSSWNIWYYVGRVVGTSASNVIDYIDLVKRYEMGLCTGLAKEFSLVSSYQKEWDVHVAPIANWLSSNGGINNSLGLWANDSSHHGGTSDFDFSKTNFLTRLDPTLYSGVTVSYANTHGNYDVLSARYGGGILSVISQTKNRIIGSHLFSSILALVSRPFFWETILPTAGLPMKATVSAWDLFPMER